MCFWNFEILKMWIGYYYLLTENKTKKTGKTVKIDQTAGPASTFTSRRPAHGGPVDGTRNGASPHQYQKRAFNRPFNRPISPDVLKWRVRKFQSVKWTSLRITNLLVSFSFSSSSTHHLILIILLLIHSHHSTHHQLIIIGNISSNENDTGA